ncbi:MAG: tRNA (guanosine(37)-N1)-methyltransferase TrmD [Clostridia bacterium]|nr:tRNA (guanosine(37)-N1)-methyltransferase TrmD [Clostridia bacterium]
MRFDLITLFPDLVMTVLGESIIGRAMKAGHIDIRAHHLREYSTDKHHNVDDRPYGGGVGMLLTCQPIADACRAVLADIPEGKRSHVVYMSPRGRLLTHDVVRELAEYDHLLFICGHYEGVDQRVLDAFDADEISIGDYVLTGGEIPACITVDAVARLIPGVLADAACYEGDSIASGLLEYPQYTHPRVWCDREVPEVLLSGDHGAIERWRLEQSVDLTRKRRPDLLEKNPQFEEMIKPKPKKARKRLHVPETESEG